MSIVGPRPCTPSEYARYSKEQRRRVEAVPGITGPCQAHAHSDSSVEAYFRLDLDYIENWSLWLDMRILCRTVLVSLGSEHTLINRMLRRAQRRFSRAQRRM